MCFGVPQAMQKLTDRNFIVQLAGNEEDCVFDVPANEAKGGPAAYYAIALTCGSRSLQEELDRKQGMSVHIAGARFRNVVQAVSYMHDNEWAHLDLKPANIVLFDSELQHNMKLIDLDSSCNLTDETQAVRAFTPEFCPPEVAKMVKPATEGNPAAIPVELVEHVKPHSSMDIWSLGCIFYQMIMGEVLFDKLVPQGTPEQTIRDRLGKLGSISQKIIDRVLSQIKGLEGEEGYGANARSLLEYMLKRGLNNVMSAVQKVEQKVTDQGEKIVREVLSLRDQLHAHTRMVRELADFEYPRTFVILPEGKKDPKAWFKEAVNWFTDLSEPKSGSWLDVCTKKVFRLYLVCELSGELQEEGFQFDMTRDWVKKLLPAMKASFKLLWLVNSTLKVGKAFAPAMFTVDGVSDDTMNRLKQYLLHMDEEDDFTEAGLTDSGDGQTRSLVLWASPSAIGRVMELSRLATAQLDACRNGITLTIAASPAAPADTPPPGKGPGGGAGRQQQQEEQPQQQYFVQKRVLRQILEAYRAKQVGSSQAMSELLEQAADEAAVEGQQPAAGRKLPSPMMPPPTASGDGAPPTTAAGSDTPVSLLDADLEQLMEAVCIPQRDGSFPRLADCGPVWPKANAPAGDDAVYFLPMAAITLPLAGRHSLPLTLLSCFHGGGEQQKAEKRLYYLNVQVQGPIGLPPPAASAKSSSSSTAASREVHVGLQLPAGSPAGLPNRAISLHPVDHTGAAHDEPHRHPLAPMALAAMRVENAVYSESLLISKYCSWESVVDSVLRTLRACCDMAAEESNHAATADEQAAASTRLPLPSSLAAVDFGQLIEEVGKRKEQKTKDDEQKKKEEEKKREEEEKRVVEQRTKEEAEKQREEGLKQKDEEVLASEEGLKVKAEEVQNREAEVLKREEEMEKREAEVKKREAEVKKVNVEVQKEKEEVQKRAEEVQKREGEVQKVKVEVQKREEKFAYKLLTCFAFRG
ncbi:hypothetical protein GPECTOR_24g208 [Gonium pectorale]|uniref:Protein kinase domain-containing protein n=1 Tax=Gonium pectorale TaxID=33097 RepID=A0A150GGF0_GONPE|nr:hypothetical protein GPECTOR_24g208 [Gonium pectorale]|eukprot:KXZ48919.1 hypothetical protein GPECTOR_24g208 [Gonium pectorale]